MHSSCMYTQTFPGPLYDLTLIVKILEVVAVLEKTFPIQPLEFLDECVSVCVLSKRTYWDRG